MADRPILFSGAMVRAILEDRKTQTRRVVKPQPISSDGGDVFWWKETVGWASSVHKNPEMMIPYSPYGQPGDRLWVRETYCSLDRECVYRADGDKPHALIGKWTPSIFMPRWASRLTLEVTEVRVERVQEISDDDCEAEGIEQRWTCLNPGAGSYAHENCVHDDFRALWDSINAKRGFGWEQNPWVWAVSFRRVEGE